MGGKVDININKKLASLKKSIILLLIAEIIQLALLYIPNFTVNIIYKIATFLSFAIIILIVYSYFYEKNRIINHKNIIYVKENNKNEFFILAISVGIIIGLITFVTKSIIISGAVAIMSLIIIIIYFYNRSNRS